mmetsp:Transcript_13325/g.1194  ORF Transcript_13325/g.1194 Transcript_13325/m.1194 type:complete len:93 (+) Transcript_13325:535-813(+)
MLHGQVLLIFAFKYVFKDYFKHFIIKIILKLLCCFDFKVKFPNFINFCFLLFLNYCLVLLKSFLFFAELGLLLLFPGFIKGFYYVLFNDYFY